MILLVGIDMFLEESRLNLAEEALREGEIIGLPTETVYGLAANPYSEVGMQKLFSLKQRDRSKPISLLVDSISSFRKLNIVSDYTDTLSLYWPGPLTVIVETNEKFAYGVGTVNPNSVGIRVPDYDSTSAFLKKTGPLAVTSANVSGKQEALSHIDAENVFKEEIVHYIKGTATLNKPSTVVDLRVPGGKILREGPLRWPPSYC